MKTPEQVKTEIKRYYQLIKIKESEIQEETLLWNIGDLKDEIKVLNIELSVLIWMFSRNKHIK